jgi:hypothetical protein
MLLLFLYIPSVWAGEATDRVAVVELTQTACQFIEPERGDVHYTAESYDACQALNEQSGEARLARAKVIELKPGDYLFRVHNRDVPYVLGFWLRGEGLERLTLPSVSGGGITTGGYKDYRITLKEGEYLYSCPLNPTPDYRLVVKQ